MENVHTFLISGQRNVFVYKTIALFGLLLFRDYYEMKF